MSLDWLWLTGKSRRERRLRITSLASLAAGLLFTGWVAFFDPLGSVRLVFSDALFRPGPGSETVVLVEIDDAALAKEGRLQDWSRDLHAQVITNLQRSGARVIVYDVLFVDRGHDDSALVSAVTRNVILPMAATSKSAAPGGRAVYDFATQPLQSLRDAGAGIGSANLVSDSDGLVRRVPLFLAGTDGQEYPALFLAAIYRQFGQALPLTTRAERGSPRGSLRGSLQVLGRAVPIEEDDSLRINYIGGDGSFAHLPVEDVLGGRFDPSLVRNKIVLVGVTAEGADIHPAPLLGRAPGVTIQANALDTLLRARFLRPVSGAENLAIMVGFIATASLVVPRLRIGLGIAAAAATGASYVVAGVFFFQRGHVLDLVDPLTALVIVMISCLVYRSMAERASHEETRALFGRYVSPAVAAELTERADRGQLHLGGELREVTVMFADLRGFTPLSQRLAPMELVALLNRYFDIIVAEVMKYDGVVNKFDGDAVMALWNAPQDQPDHALLACRAATAAQRRLEAASRPDARFGFGVNTGMAVAGNVGADGRLEYTVIGDCVNLAARLCGAAGPGDIWIGQSTYDAVKGEMAAGEVSSQSLKGFEAPVAIYILGLEAPVRATLAPAN